MQRLARTLLFLTLILCACSNSPSVTDSALPSAQPLPVTEIAPGMITDSPTPSIPTTESTVAVPQTDQTPGENIPDVIPTDSSCGYQWAYQDLPQLSSDFQQSIQGLQPQAQANAYTFGENCLHEDGSIGGFSAKETDFNVTLQVNDLSNESDLGDWIVKVMQVIENIPPDQIVGPGPGLVHIIFQANGEQKAVNFYTNQYQALPAGLTKPEIYQALQTAQ